MSEKFNSLAYGALDTKVAGSRDLGPTLAIGAVTLLAVFSLMLPLVDIITNGASILSFDFITQSPSEAGRKGGIASILVSTSMIVSISMAAAFPLAFGTAMLLSQSTTRKSVFASAVRVSLDILAGVPSIVFGLFGIAFFCRQLGMGYSILAGGLTLSCMILPTLTRAICTAFESMGDQYNISGTALGLSRIATLWHVTLPVALPGITAGFVLALTRSLAETAVLLCTSGYADRMPESVSDSGRSISVHIYELATNVPGGQANAYGSALVLILVLAVISILAHVASNCMQRKLLDMSVFSGR